MKTIQIFLLFMALLLFVVFAKLIYFNAHKPSNEALTIDWIFKAKKPIVCYPYAVDAFGKTIYTLIDANSGVYMTGKVTLALPDTIK